MSEMIERVARALDQFAWSQSAGMERRRADSLFLASAAIEAMRDPTPAMQQAVAKNWGRRTWAEYSEVIDAALATTPKES